MAIGGVSGALAVIVPLGIMFAVNDTAGSVATATIFYGAVGAGIGMGIGAAIDGAIHKKILVFQTPAAQIGLLPIMTTERKGLALTLRF